jgi:hypothetical protein
LENVRRRDFKIRKELEKERRTVKKPKVEEDTFK